MPQLLMPRRPVPDLQVQTLAGHKPSRGMTLTGVDEPALFSEPGVFLIRPALTLYWRSVQTMPFARPSFKEMLGAIDFVLEKNYPARGEA